MSRSRTERGDDRTLWHGRFSRVAGQPRNVTLEHATHPDKVDHVWISLEVPRFDTVLAVVNTTSQKSHALGLDSRVRVALVREPFKNHPPAGLFRHDKFDYETIGEIRNAFFEPYEKRDLELLLIQKANEAGFIEVWGDVYVRNHQLGVHQIHSRRASCAVPEDIRGRDGALKCYFDQRGESELMLFKFCGQP